MRKNNLICLMFIFGLMILFSGFVSAGFDPGSICGNGILEEGEECDTGWDNPDFGTSYTPNTYGQYDLCNSEDCECGTASSLESLLDSQFGRGRYWFISEDKFFGFNGTCKKVSDCRLEHICLGERCYLEDETTMCSDDYGCNYYDSKITVQTGVRCNQIRDDIRFPDCGNCQNVYNLIPNAFNCIETMEGDDGVEGYDMCYYSSCDQTEEYSYNVETYRLMCGDCNGVDNGVDDVPTPTCRELLNDDRVNYKCSGGGGFPVYQPWMRSEELGGGTSEEAYSVNSRIFFNQTEKLFGCLVSSAINPGIVNTAKSDISYTIVSAKLIDYFDNVLETVSIGEEVFMSCGAGDTEFEKNIKFGYVPDENTKATRCEVEITVVDSAHSSRIYSSGFIADFDGDGHNGISRTGGVNCTISYPSPYSSQCKGFSKEFPVSDCNDWVLDDNAPKIRDFTKTCSQGFKDFLEAGDKNAYCYEDTNNDGVGDFAICSYCINPGMREDADDIDNDCKGSCQGVNPLQAPRSCLVKNYNGDGKSDPTLKNITATDRLGREVITPFGCGDVVNEWGISDNFCQMVDNTKEMKYDRMIKSGYKIIESTGYIKYMVGSEFCPTKDCYVNRTRMLIFSPGGISLPFDWGLRSYDAMIGTIDLYQIKEKKNSDKITTIFVKYPNMKDKSLVEYDFFSQENKEAEGRSRNTKFFSGSLDVIQGNTLIDSFRGEFYWLFDRFYEDNKEEISRGFNWTTQNVIKDKCMDGADNDAPKDLRKEWPFKEYFQGIDEIYGEGGASLDLTNVYLPLIPLFDGDDPSCVGRSPYTEEPYCIDEDEDGFCKNSEVFPDCIDSENDVPGFYNLEDMNYFEYIGFPSLGSRPIVYSDFHPFAPVSPSSCKFGQRMIPGFDPYYPNRAAAGLDLNCNKNGAEGTDYTLLLSGKTPFDSNLYTGMEYYDHIRFGAPHSKSLENICQLEPLGKDANTFLGVMFGAMWTLPFATLGAIQIAPTVQTFVGSKITAFNSIPVRILGANLRLGQVIGGYLRAGGIHHLITVAPESGERIMNLVTTGHYEANVWNILDDVTLVTGLMGLTYHKYALPGVGVQGNVMLVTEGGKRMTGKAKKTLITVASKMNQGINKVRNRKFANSGNPGTPAAGGCFLENTSVMLENGSYMNIEDLEIGMSVRAWDLENNISVNAPITTTFIRDETKYLEVEY